MINIPRKRFENQNEENYPDSKEPTIFRKCKNLNPILLWTWNLFVMVKVGVLLILWSRVDKEFKVEERAIVAKGITTVLNFPKKKQYEMDLWLEILQTGGWPWCEPKRLWQKSALLHLWASTKEVKVSIRISVTKIGSSLFRSTGFELPLEFLTFT